MPYEPGMNELYEVRLVDSCIRGSDRMVIVLGKLEYQSLH